MSFENFGFTCPNCKTYYTVFDGSKGFPSQKQYDMLVEVTKAQVKKGYCKFCKRKDPNVPTTAEMDGLFTQEDMRNRFKVMKQCTACSKWTQQDTKKADVPCHNCGAIAYDIQSTKSLRTFNPLTDSKRKVKK